MKLVKVKTEAISKFDSWEPETAQRYISARVISSLEGKKIFLHTLFGYQKNRARYERETVEERIFNTEKIQSIFAALDRIVKPSFRYYTRSDNLGERIISHLRESENHIDCLTISEIVTAMLLKGYSARFVQDENEFLLPYCQFNASLL